MVLGKWEGGRGSTVTEAILVDRIVEEDMDLQTEVEVESQDNKPSQVGVFIMCGDDVLCLFDVDVR